MGKGVKGTLRYWIELVLLYGDADLLRRSHRLLCCIHRLRHATGVWRPRAGWRHFRASAARFRLAWRLVFDYTAAVYQIIFSKISANELSAIPTLEQLELMSGFQVEDDFLNGKKEDPRFGVVEKEGRRIFRFRSKDYRVYFTIEDSTVVVQRVLHADSLKDFLFRAGMVGSEDQKLGESRSFWKMIDAGENSPRKN